jgi:hypothetical protein
MTKRDINETVKRISDEIEVLRDQATKRGLAFSSPTTEQLEKKLKSSQTPFINGMSWVSRAPAASSFFYDIYVYNPDPNPYYNLFAYFFFGPANMVSDVGTALLSVDQRLYRAFKRFPYIFPNSSGVVEFNYNFPTGIPLGLYMGNGFIFQPDYHDVGSYMDRGCIDVEIY